MTAQTRVAPPVPPPQRHGATGEPRSAQGLLALTVLAAVVVVDQAARWWAWRHVTGAVINPGATGVLGSTVSAWYSEPVGGGLLDLLSVEVLTLGAFTLLRGPRPLLVLVSGSLMIGGWGSNLLDRLGMHRVTASGSARGAVDFIRLGPYLYNLADVCIASGTVLFVVAGCLRRLRTSRGAAARGPMRQSRRPQPWVSAWRWTVVAAVGPLVVAGTAYLLTVPGSGGRLAQVPGAGPRLSTVGASEVPAEPDQEHVLP